VFGQSGSSDHSTPPPPPPSSPAPAPKKRRNWWWKLKAIVYTGTLGSLVAAGYYVYQANHPPDQLPFDPSKKTVVVLGSGWGATALLDKIDTEHYNIVVISPSNYFLFTPLLPSVTVGTLNGRSITQPTRHLVRYKKREVQVLDAEATKIDVENKTVTFEDKSDITGNLGTAQIPYDYLVVSIGSENQTFGIEGVKKYALFLKELSDAEAIRRRLMDW
jgi:NADH:ubiquinone reductase (non-electrogenic)